jgi:hypothetical protein
MVGIVCTLVTLGWAQGPAGSFEQFWGPRYSAPPTSASLLATRQPAAAAVVVDRLHHWNRIAVDSSGLDHTPVPAGDSRVFGEQLGPGRSSRAMAIVHIAIFDAVNAIAQRYRSFTNIPDAPAGASMDAAIAQAAHDTLVKMFPSQAAHCDQLLAEDLAAIPDGFAKDEGVKTGRLAAAAILARTQNDGADHAEPRLGIEYFTDDRPGKWRQDPISQLPVALGAFWGDVKPLVINSVQKFRVPPPPTLGSPTYAAAFNEVKALGGDGTNTQSTRTSDQTSIGIYWAYDGTPALCAPPRLYNQLAITIAEQMGTDLVDLARLLAILNTSLADAGIACWESKYHYEFWRPITGIREADSGTGPTGRGDNNPDTEGDPTYSPLGAPASNLQGPNFTPPFPAYPSGHAAFGGATFQTLRNFYGTDNIQFTFVSDELNGVTRDNENNERPLQPRTFSSLSQAEDENGQSRIYLGIHWSFDKTEGIKQGRAIADYVFKNAFASR